MIGYSNSVSLNLRERPEDLRRQAANAAAVRAARSAARHAARMAAEAKAIRRDQAAAFSWETHQVRSRIDLPRLLSRVR